MSVRELNEWAEFYEIEPFGIESEWMGHAIVASTVANASRDPKKKPQPFKPSDFMPETSRSRVSKLHSKTMDPRRVKADLIAAFGGRIKTKGGGGGKIKNKRGKGT